MSLMTGISVERLTEITDLEADNSTEIGERPTPTEVSCTITLTMGLILVSKGAGDKVENAEVKVRVLEV